MAYVTEYGDISPRTAAYAVAELLRVALPYLCIEKFGQTYELPTNKTKVAKFRRYNALALALNPLVEGVTPSGQKQTVTDVTVTLLQFGDFVGFTDQIEDTHEDKFLMATTGRLGEQAAQTIETVRFNVIKAGTNVVYATGASRLSVNVPISLDVQRKATRALKRQNATKFTQVVKSTPAFSTEPVEASYVCMIHPDMESDVRNMTGFIPVKKYGTVTPWENEIGAVDDVRYISSTLYAAFPNAATSATLNGMVSTGGTYPDVYPALLVAKDAYGIVPLKGKAAATVAVVNPKPAPGDPLGQRGTAGWKVMQNCVILNDAWMVRIECGATN